MNDVLAIILGGGQGSRLFPLTETRSKPAVPIGGNYRLIDIPVSGCIHAGIRRIFVLTQFNSASLNRHISQTYRMDAFPDGFVEILAAEQTPDNPHWFQGTADAVRQAMRHVEQHDARYYLILAGDHLYRMDYGALIEAHRQQGADVTIAAQPMPFDDAPEMGIFRFDRGGRIVAFEEKPTPERLREIGRSVPAGATAIAHDDAKPFMASMGIYVFTREVLLDILARHSGVDFGRELIPAAIETFRVNSYIYDGFWADVGTIEAFYDANIMLAERLAPFRLYDPKRPIYTHPRFLPGSRFTDARITDAIVAEGCYVDKATIEQSVIGIRTHVYAGSVIRRSVLLGADFYEGLDEPLPPEAKGVRLGIGEGVTLDQAIVDKNARIGAGATLVNAKGVQHADGDGYYIRSGIIIVPRGGVILPGTEI